MKRGLIALVAGAMLGNVEMNVPVTSLTNAYDIYTTNRKQRRSILSGGFGGQNRMSRGPGWTVAQVKRMAKKRKNKQRHRKACRKVGAA